MYVCIATPKEAPEIISAMVGLTGMWGIAMAVLGIAVWKRSSDKALAAGHAPGGGLMGLARALGAGRQS